MPRGRRGSAKAKPRHEPRIAAGSGFEGSGWHRAILVLIGLKALAMIVALDPVGLQAFELPKALVSRAIAWPLGALLLVAVLRYGRGVLPRSLLHVVVALFAASQVVALAFAEQPYIGLYGERGSYQGVAFLADMVVLYLAAAIALRRPGDWIAPGIGIAGGFAVAALYAVTQFFALDPYDLSREETRPGSTFGSTVRYAHFLAAMFAGSAALAVLPPEGPWRRACQIGGTGLGVLALALAGIVASRGVFIGIGAGLLALLVLAARAKRFSKQRVLQFSVLVLLLGLASIGVLIATPAGERISGRLSDLAAEDRLIIYAVAIDAFKERPVTGFGPDNFSVAYTRHRTQASEALGADIIENSAHNWLLHTAVTTGVLGAVALLLVVFAWVRALLAAVGPAASTAATVGAAGAAYWAQGLVSVGTMSVDWLPWLMLGGTAALTGQASDRRGGLALPAFLLISIVAASAVPAWTGAAAFQANRAAWSASRAYAAEDGSTAVAEAKRAVQADPGRADHWNWLGLAHTLRNEWKPAADAFAAAADRAPYDSTYWQNLARGRTLQSLAGDRSDGGPEAAVSAIRRAIDVEPAEPSTYEVGAEILYSLGRPEAALDMAVEGHERSGYVPSDELVTRAAKVVDEYAQARTALERLVQVRETAALRAAIARVALGMADYDAARVNAKRALEIAPGNPEATDVLLRTGT